jgi:hypothetical protein
LRVFKNRFNDKKVKIDNDILKDFIKIGKKDFGIDENKKRDFEINNETIAYRYNEDGVSSVPLRK